MKGKQVISMEKIAAKNAPEAIGPYSQAVKHNGLVFTAGQIALNPKTNQMTEENIADQAKQVLENLKAVLEAAGSSLDDAIKVNVYLKDISDFQTMNEIYAQYIKNKPARATIQAAKLPKNALIEMDVIAKVRD